MREMLGWHFLRNDSRLGYDDGRLVTSGKTYTVPKDRALELCRYGMHASRRIIDALRYAKGCIVCRVELSDAIIAGKDKAVAYSRRVLWMLDATRVLHEFACRCVEDAIALVDNPDLRSMAAIAAKRAWLSGKMSAGELAAAQDAALDAALDAWGAQDAAWVATQAAARAAGWDALTAAQAAVRAAALDAAQTSAWVAAQAAARATEWNDIRAAQNKRLSAMVCAARGR